MAQNPLQIKPPPRIPLPSYTPTFRGPTQCLPFPGATESHIPRRRIKIHVPIAAPPTKTPMMDLTTLQLAVLDPTGTRQKLISRANKDALRPGDIVQVRRKNGLQPFSGVLMNIRRRGVDSGILLRNTLTRVGVEMWFKLYSPTIDGIDIVQRKEKRSARAKLYFMRYVLEGRMRVGAIL